MAILASRPSSKLPDFILDPGEIKSISARHSLGSFSFRPNVPNTIKRSLLGCKVVFGNTRQNNLNQNQEVPSLYIITEIE